MNVDKYRVETNVIDDKWIELDDVINVTINQHLVRTDKVVKRTIDEILVDCIIDGRVTLLWGDGDQFNFVRR